MSDEKKKWADMTREEKRAHNQAGRDRAALKRAQFKARPPMADLAEPIPEVDAALAEGDVSAPVTADVSGDAEAAAERRRRLLGDISAADAALFTDEDLLKIEQAADAKAKKARKANALRDVEAAALMYANVGEGVLPQSVLRDDSELKRMNEDVTFRIIVPLGGAGAGRVGIRINQFLYEYGRTYTRPRHVFESLHEIIYRSNLQEVRFRTLGQDEPGQSPVEVLGRTMPQIEVRRAA